MTNPALRPSLLVAACLVIACTEPDPAHVAASEPTSDAKPVGDPVASEAEQQRMRQYLDELQDPDAIVHGFESRSGEWIDCVDTLAQPGLRRSGMEDHEIQFEPENPPALEDGVAPAAGATAMQDYIVPGEYDGRGDERACPAGSVPILRLTMATLARFATIEDFRRKAPPQVGPTDFHQYAHAYRFVDNMGAQSVLNLWNPYIEKSSEFSLSQIWVTRGFGDSLETVETGWQNYPDLYGDWNSRLFIYFTPDNYGSGGCYNLSCGAFVQVDNSVVIGGHYSAYSAVDGPQFDVTLFWYKDGPGGHWWLAHGDVWVGYYPIGLFDDAGLRDHASMIDFGGEILDTEFDGVHTQTDMGSGGFAYLGWMKTAYQRNLRYVDIGNYWQEASGLTASHTNYWCYDILLYDWGDWMNHFYFGGSGYNIYCE